MAKKRKPTKPQPAAENTTEPSPTKRPSEPTTKGFDLSKVPPGVEDITGNPEKIREALTFGSITKDSK